MNLFFSMFGREVDVDGSNQNSALHTATALHTCMQIN